MSIEFPIATCSVPSLCGSQGIISKHALNVDRPPPPRRISVIYLYSYIQAGRTSQDNTQLCLFIIPCAREVEKLLQEDL